MRLGIFAKTFEGATPAAALGAAKSAGFEAVQYNMACSGLPSLPEAIDGTTAAAVAAAARATGVEIVAVSATYNMVDPDPARRASGRAGLAAVAGAARAMGASLVTLCTGSLDPADQWRTHPDNSGSAAWREMVAEFARILPVAERNGVFLGVEPELANVVSSPERARRLIGELGADRIRIVLDPANLFEVAPADRGRALIDRAIGELAPFVALAHAKDRAADGGFAAPGAGVIDFPHFFGALSRAGYRGPVVAHGFGAGDAARVATFLRGALGAAEPAR
ncbi:MAG: sugar phosphate isomerase/epimerase [Hyphomicrobiales bacterium]|nr:sugar phosphate isomerase/epimerase [Hyphomicrobiales bacterium]